MEAAAVAAVVPEAAAAAAAAADEAVALTAAGQSRRLQLPPGAHLSARRPNRGRDSC